MARAICKVTIRTDQQREDGRSAVRIRITKGRLARYYNTGVFLLYSEDKRKTEWNEEWELEKKNWVRTKHRDHAQLNDLIKEIYDALDTIAARNPTFTAEQVRDACTTPEEEPEQRQGFIAFAREWIRRKHSNGQHGTAKVYEVSLSYFLGFWGKRADTPELLTPTVISELVRYLKTVPVSKKKKGMEASTINLALRNYRTFFKNAVLEGWLPRMPNPFDIPPQEEHDKPLLRPTAEQLLSLMHAEGLTRVQKNACNVLLMQYFLNGARASEVLTLRWGDVHDERVDYRPKKRSKKKKSIKRHAGIDWVLNQYKKKDKYVFPYLGKVADRLEGEELQQLLVKLVTNINGSLAQVSKKSKLPFNLTSHMARRAFADSVLARTDDMRKVQAAVGWESASSAARYVEKLGLQPVDELSESIYSEVNISGKP
jgi:integrase